MTRGGPAVEEMGLSVAACWEHRAIEALSAVVGGDYSGSDTASWDDCRERAVDRFRVAMAGDIGTCLRPLPRRAAELADNHIRDATHAEFAATVALIIRSAAADAAAPALSDLSQTLVSSGRHWVQNRVARVAAAAVVEAERESDQRKARRRREGRRRHRAAVFTERIW